MIRVAKNFSSLSKSKKTIGLVGVGYALSEHICKNFS